MNYLAHLFLADDDPDALIGSLMGDFAKGHIDQTLPPAMRHGIRLHRRIDSFTDSHQVVQHSKRLIRPEYRRYAGILIDMFYDHYLARHWQDYSHESLDVFAEKVSRVVLSHMDRLPPSMKRSMTYMIRNDLLLSYREVAGIRRALRGIETRLKRPSGLRHATEDLALNYTAFGEDFFDFFPLLIDFVRQQNETDVAVD